MLLCQESLRTQCLESGPISRTEPSLPDKPGSCYLCAHHHGTVHGSHSSQEPPQPLMYFQDVGSLPLALLLKATSPSLLSLQDTQHSLFNESDCLLQLVHSALLQPIPEPGEHKTPFLAGNGRWEGWEKQRENKNKIISWLIIPPPYCLNKISYAGLTSTWNKYKISPQPHKDRFT